MKENEITLENKDVYVMIIGHVSVDPNAQRSLDYIVNELKDNYRNAVSYTHLTLPTKRIV